MNNLYKEAMDEINISDQCLRKVKSMNNNNYQNPDMEFFSCNIGAFIFCIQHCVICGNGERLNKPYFKCYRKE